VAHPPIGPGTLLARRFLLEDLLDESEGARFWRATDRILARDVAVHVVPDDDPRSAAMLSAARTSATVTDGHLLRVLDAASEDGVSYVVNEWGTGVSLDRLLDDGPLTPRRAAWVVKEAAEAITTAHRHGVAHGRLLPENVVITDSGSVKLIGFVVDAVLRGNERTRVTDGTPLTEHEADVVDLAALLYACLVGRWPGSDGSRLPAAPCEHGRCLRPRQVRAGIPRPLDAICERVLNPDPEHVPPIETAHEIYAALSDYVGEAATAAPVGLEATTMIPEHELSALREQTAAASQPPEDAPDHPDGADGAADTGNLDATQAGTPVFDVDSEATRAVDSEATRTVDPEATQAGAAPTPRAESGRRAPHPPPPPFPEAEPRPLFASDAPRRPRPAATATAARSGELPAVWGPDAAGPPDDTGDYPTGGWQQEKPGRGWLRLALAIAGLLVLVVAVVLAFNLGRGSTPTGADDAPGQGSDSSSPAQQPARSVEIAAVSDFDPEADPAEENPDLAPLAIDGDPSTAWRTSTYFDPLELQKSGVGLLLDLGERVDVREVEVTLVGSPTGVELLAADPGAGAPESLDGLETVASAPEAGREVTLSPEEPTDVRHLVVWLTTLPPADGGFVGQIAEVDVRS
jgi:hypothetical protein